MAFWIDGAPGSAVMVKVKAPSAIVAGISLLGRFAWRNSLDDRITDIEDAVEDSFARDRDPDRFGPADRRTGLFGTMSLSYTGRTGNTENQDLAIAGRVQPQRRALRSKHRPVHRVW